MSLKLKQLGVCLAAVLALSLLASSMELGAKHQHRVIGYETLGYRREAGTPTKWFQQQRLVAGNLPAQGPTSSSSR